MCCYIQFFLDIFKYIEFPLKKFIIHDIQTSSFCDVVFFFKIQFFLDNFYLLNLISMGKKFCNILFDVRFYYAKYLTW